MISIDRSHWPYIHLHQPKITNGVIGRVSLVISTICGSTFSGFAKTLERALSPFSLVFVSEVLNFLFILFSYGLLPTLRRLLRLSRKQVIPLAILGMMSGVVAPMLWFTGLSMTTAVNASLFGKSEVIFIITLAHLALGERIGRAHIIALATILGGLLFISLRGFTQQIHFQIGDFVIIASTLSYATGNIMYRRFLPDVEPHIPLFARSVSAITLFFVLSSFIHGRLVDEIAVFPLTLIPALIGFGFISRFLNSLLYYQAIEYVPMTTVGLFSTMDIVGSALFAHLYLGESIYWYHMVGGALLVLGNILLTAIQSRENRKHEAPSIHPHLAPTA